MMKRLSTIQILSIYGVFVEKNADEWISDLQESCLQISNRLAKICKWWWATSAARLDPRPLANEHLIKPLFFSRAILDWFEKNPKEAKLVVVGSDNKIASYISEMSPNTKIRNSDTNFEPLKYSALIQLAKASIGIFKYTARVAVTHSWRAKPNLETRNLFVIETALSQDPSKVHSYYFTTLLDEVSNQTGAVAVAGVLPTHVRKKDLSQAIVRAEKPYSFALFDYIHLFDAVAATAVGIFVLFIQFVTALQFPPVTIAEKTSRKYWAHYFISLLCSNTATHGYLCYRALKQLLKNGAIKRMIAPHEGKAIEKSIAFAANEFDVKSMAYSPHPQSKLNLAILDLPEYPIPQPESYALCGGAYRKFYDSCGKPESNSMEVWGTNKCYQGYFEPVRGKQGPINILVTTNNIGELSIFRSWLKADTRLATDVEFHLRKYWAIDNQEYDELEKSITIEFKNVSVVDGMLKDNAEHVDAILFCATSAGIETTNYGRLGIFADLFMFLENDPCLGDISPWNPCSSAKELADFLEYLNSADEAEFLEIYRKQKLAANEIFSPIDKTVLNQRLIAE